MTNDPHQVDYATPLDDERRRRRLRRTLIAAVLLAVVAGVIVACAGFLQFSWSMR